MPESEAMNGDANMSSCEGTDGADAPEASWVSGVANPPEARGMSVERRAGHAGDPSDKVRDSRLDEWSPDANGTPYR